MSFRTQQQVAARRRRALLGRSEELSAGGELLDRRVPIVTIWGTAGVGKTTLAEVLAANDPRPVVRVDLASTRELSGIVEALVEALGVPGSEGDTLESTLETIEFALSQRTGDLLFLDNVEHLVDDVTALLESWSVKPGVLLTSRQPTHIEGEICVALGVLDEEAAVEMFHRRAEAQSADYERDDETVRLLVNELDRLPLAIELAAGRVTIMRPVDILGRMNERFALLSSPDRRQRLDASIDLSWQLLDSTEQAALSNLAMLDGPFDSEVERALGVSDSVQRLVDCALVAENRAARQLLVTIREFAQARASEGLRDETMRALRDYYLDEAQRRFEAIESPAAAESYAWLAFHRPHIVQAALHASEAAPNESTALLLAVGPAYMRSGVMHVYEDLVLQVAPTDADLRRRWLCQRALIATTIGSNVDSRALLAEAETLDPDRQDFELYQRRYWSHRENMDLEAAESELLTAIELAQELGNEKQELEFGRMLCSLRNNLSIYGLRPADTLPENHQELLRIYERTREVLGMVHELAAIETLAYSYKGLGQPEMARDAYEKAYDRMLPNSGWESSIRIGHSKVERELGNHERALELALEAVDCARRTGRRGFLYSSWCEAGDRAWHLGRYEESLRYYDETLEGGRRYDQAIAVQGGLLGRASVLTDLRRFEDARKDIDEVRKLQIRAMGDLTAKCVEATILAADGEYEAAHALLDETLPKLRSMPTYGDAGDAWEDLWHARLRLFEVPGLLERGQVAAARAIVERAHALVAEHAPNAAASIGRNGAVLSLRNQLEFVEAEHPVPDSKVERAVLVSRGGDWFEIDGRRIDLGHRASLAGILAALASRGDLTTEDVVAVGWPGELMDANSARNRVYAAIRQLRKLGLEGYLESKSGTYHFAPDVYVRVVD